MNPWLLTIGPPGRHRGPAAGRPDAPRPRVRVIALPHAGGWPSAFQTWRRVLPDHVELQVAQLPGRGMRSGEEPLRDVEPLVDGLLGAVVDLDPLPTVVLGHSFGSVLGYELAKRMERLRLGPALVAVSARQPPCFPSRAPFAHQGSDEELLRHLVDIGGLSPQLLNRPEVVDNALGAIRADLQALETYARPMTGTTVPILALGATDDPVVVAERLHLWSVETTGGFRRRMFTGGHFYLYDPATAAVIAEDLLDAVGDPAPLVGATRPA